MSRDLAESHQVVGRSWPIRTRPVELLTRRHGDCVELEARIRRARRELASARSDGLQQALVEIESDLGTYLGLLAEREAHLGWAGPLPLPRGGGGASDVISLGAAITEFVQRSRGDVAEAERLGDPESAGILAEITRVAETWLWDLATVPGNLRLARQPYAEARMRTTRRFTVAMVLCLASIPVTLSAQAKSLPQQIADVMVQLNGGVHTGYRFAHAKGLVLTGTFTPAPGARKLSRAAHLAGPAVPVTVRLSDGTGVPQINDNNANASPRGMAIRFTLPRGGFTDIVANSHNGFFVGTGEDFLAFLKAVAATTPTSPHPSPIEQFLGSHPRALKVITDSKALPKSFATLDFYGNNAFLFVDSAGTKRAGRYQIMPVAGVAHLDSVAASKATPNYLFDDLRRRIARGPIAYRLFVQVANAGDPTKDGSIVWPDDRKRVELGTITLAAVAPNNDELQKSLTFNPIYLTDGIQLSDDPFIALRSAVYALSVAHRH